MKFFPSSLAVPCPKVNPCRNGGVCRNKPNDHYVCLCVNDYIGSHCETSKFEIIYILAELVISMQADLLAARGGGRGGIRTLRTPISKPLHVVSCVCIISGVFISYCTFQVLFSNLHGSVIEGLIQTALSGSHLFLVCTVVTGTAEQL